MAPPVARRVPYKDFLQPALQRRFAGTAALVLGLTYFEALTLSKWDSILWPWMPLGPTGLRALVLFLSTLPIIVLRIAHAHMGIRTSNSIFEIVTSLALLFSTLETILTYLISAFFFSQIYLLSTPEEAGIRWISRATGRSRLNEQALFYTVSLVVLGLVQSVLHLVLDQDRLVLGTVKSTRREARDGGEVNAADTTAHAHWATKIGEGTPTLLVRSGILAISVPMLNYAVLYHFFRFTAWRSSMGFFRFFYGDLPKYNLPVGNAPWSFWMLIRTIWASLLLCLLWQFGDLAFRVQLTREPLKKEQPLTSESKDPNDSLVSGLRSKKPRIAAFAMWELAFIARDYAPRRQAIFEDIDRKDGPMWTQIYTACLDVIKGIERSIDEYGKPPKPTPETEPSPAPEQPRRRISQPLNTGDVSAPRPPVKSSLVKDTVTRLVTSPGKTPIEEWMPVVKGKAVLVADKVLGPEKKEALQPEALRGLVTTMVVRLLAVPVIGPFFQRTFDRQLAKAVMGSPYADTSLYVNAAYALSQLAVCSLTEDKYGNVQRDIASIIRTYTAVIKKLEAYRDHFPTHWTDLSKQRQSPEISEVLVALKGGLGALVTAFDQYSRDLKLTRADMRLAKQAAEEGLEEHIQAVERRSPEMQQCR
ncbi:nucleoporin protein Ndc1-Nup [Xylaria sp. CBS 124048]|nr:nucleoporin protein Ndc1-Nup [Xylaria sp. CBS 124048]